MPVPGKSSAEWRRWNAPKSFEAYASSNPAPLSLTKYSGVGARVVPHTELDVRRGTPAGEFPRILEEIGHDNLEEPGVPGGLQAGLHGPLDDAVLIRVGERRPACVCARALRVDRLQMQVHSRHPGELEQVVDEATHVLRGGPDAAQVVLTRQDRGGRRSLRVAPD